MVDAVRFEVDDRQFQAAMRRVKQAVSGPGLVAAAQAGALVIQNAAKEKAPRRTSTLSRSIHMEWVEQGRYRVAVHVGTDVIYARIHEFGGIITPRQARALAFEIGGELIFAQRVHIPARPYMRPAVDENIAKIGQEIARTIEALVTRALR